jgi:hypothetical protein
MIKTDAYEINPFKFLTGAIVFVLFLLNYFDNGITYLVYFLTAGFLLFFLMLQFYVSRLFLLYQLFITLLDDVFHIYMVARENGAFTPEQLDDVDRRLNLIAQHKSRFDVVLKGIQKYQE